MLDDTIYNVPLSVVKDMKLWHVEADGLYGYGMNNVTFDGWTQIGDRNRLSNRITVSQGLWFGDYLTRNVTIKNANIQGVQYGIIAPIQAGLAGGSLRRRGDALCHSRQLPKKCSKHRHLHHVRRLASRGAA